SNDEIVEMLLDHHPVDWRGRHIALQRLPHLTVVEGNVKTIFRTHVKESRSHRILTNAMRITQHAAWNTIRDCSPRLPVIFRLVDEGIAIVYLVEINRQVSSTRF